MKIGDMVIRAYAWHKDIPGIIVDERITYDEGADEETGEQYRYPDHQFVVQWSDGLQSLEMDVELDYLSEALAAYEDFKSRAEHRSKH